MHGTKGQYLRFERERTQPSRDLTARIKVSEPRAVLDLGCGPGNSTAVLAERFGSERVTGAHVKLESLAGRFHYSAEHTSRLVRAATGRTFKALVREIRLDKARTLLASTDLSVEQVCHAVGYESLSSFQRLFRSTFGMTPTEHRTLARSGAAAV